MVSSSDEESLGPKEEKILGFSGLLSHRRSGQIFPEEIIGQGWSQKETTTGDKTLPRPPTQLLNSQFPHADPTSCEKEQRIFQYSTSSLYVIERFLETET